MVAAEYQRYPVGHLSGEDRSGAKAPTGHPDPTWPGGRGAPVKARLKGGRVDASTAATFSRFVPESTVPMPTDYAGAEGCGMRS